MSGLQPTRRFFRHPARSHQAAQNRDTHSPDVALACAPVDPCSDRVLDKASVDIGLSSEQFLRRAEGAARNALSLMNDAPLTLHLLRRALLIRRYPESQKTLLSIPGPVCLISNRQ